MSRVSILMLIVLSSLPISYCYKPIVAMFANSRPENDYEVNTKSFVTGTYMRWLQEAGAEVMIIQPWYTIEQIDLILGKINGVLFQGGSRNFKSEANWEKLAKHMIDKSIEYKSKGEIFPIWGTCQGFQLIHQLMSGAATEADILEQYDNMQVMSKVVFTEKTSKARMFSLFRPEDFTILSDQTSTVYYHTYGVSNTTFNKYAPLGQYLDVTSLGNDKKGKEFINTIEGKDGLPIYATQFHSEKTAYDRSSVFIFEQNSNARKISQLLSLFFVSETQKSTHRMNDEERRQYDFVTSYSKGNWDTLDDNEYHFSKKTTEHIE